MAKPFLKWAGGKSRLLAQMAPHLPRRFNRYHQPFHGSGVLFFWLGENGFDRQAFLSDGNRELINCYVCVRDKQVCEP